MTLGAVAMGFSLGLLAGAMHLLVTARRARLVCSGQTGTALCLLPLAFAGPVAAVWFAAASSPVAAWATLPGIFTVRTFWLSRVRGVDGS